MVTPIASDLYIGRGVECGDLGTVLVRVIMLHVLLLGGLIIFSIKVDVANLDSGHPVGELRVESNNVGVLWEIRFILTATFASDLKLAASASVDFNLINDSASANLHSREILAFWQFEALVLATVTLTTLSFESSAVSVLDAHSS